MSNKQFMFITKSSKKRFIRNMKNYAKQYLNTNDITHHHICDDELVFTKTYVSINNILHMILSYDVSSIIASYLNDEIVIYYKLLFFKLPEITYHYIIMESVDNQINLQNYNFKLYYVIIQSDTTKYKLHINKYRNNIFRCETNVDWLPNIIDMDKYFTTDITEVFNSFMMQCYDKMYYIKHVPDSNIMCFITNNSCTLYYDFERVNIKVYNKKKMKNMIRIVKIITALFRKFVVKFLHT